MRACRICKHTAGNKTYPVREMMFGFRNEFQYIQCASCGCLQILEFPEDISRYYPASYYSYQNTPDLFDGRTKSFFKYLRRATYFSGKNFLQRLFLKVYHPPEYFSWLEKVGVGVDSSILDIGCGIGHLLIRMRKDGYRYLTGIDPFVPKTICYENGVTVWKKALPELEGRFDFIMAHHSLEHMPDQQKVFQEIARLLKPQRYALIRVPVVSGYAWEKYRENWVNLDAPRHYFLHTPQSMRILVEGAGLDLKEIIFDSDALQFWGSEQYQQDIPLRHERSFAENQKLSVFSRKQIQKFREEARELNDRKLGDMACFYIYKNR